jgi:hypothetical protein
MKYFRLSQELVTKFELFCKVHGLREGDTVGDLIKKFLRENEGQHTLDAFPKKQDPALAVFEKARILEARDQLLWIVETLEKEPGKRQEIQLDLVRALKIVEPLYIKTRDPELSKLLERIQLTLGK